MVETVTAQVVTKVHALAKATRRLPLPPPHAALALLFGILTIPSPASAHRLDEYLQATIVDIEPGDIRLRIHLTPGMAVAEQVLAHIDRDRDGVISPDEAAAYAERLKRDLVLRLDGRDLGLTLATLDVPGPADLHTGWGIIRVEFSAGPGPLRAGPHRLTLENWHLPMASAYLFNAARPASDSVRITRQKRNDDQSTGEIEFTFEAPATSSRVAWIAASAVTLLIAASAVVWRARQGKST